MFPRFWDQLADHGDHPAIVDVGRGRTLSYAALADRVQRTREGFEFPQKSLAFLAATNDMHAIASYLALLSAGHTVCFASPTDDLLRRYRPQLLIASASEAQASGAPRDYRMHVDAAGYCVGKHESRAREASIFPATAALLATSGSTGSPRMARLSFENIAASAAQVAAALGIQRAERHILSLPMHSAYGLSVLNSCLSAGATVILAPCGIMRRGFWEACRVQEVTTLPAVPTMLQFMQSLGVEKFHLPTLQRITISGAATPESVQTWLRTTLVAKGIHITSMYGMTEATSRICVLPPQEYAEKPHCVGRVVPYGELRVREDGHIQYRGPNAMLGYATSEDDLSRGDELGGVLDTGDVGRIDAQGNLFITGRSSRIAKILGTRISLDDVERSLSAHTVVAVTSNEDTALDIHVVGEASSALVELIDACSATLRIPRHLFRLKRVEALPLTPSGKILYAKLNEVG